MLTGSITFAAINSNVSSALTLSDLTTPVVNLVTLQSEQSKVAVVQQPVTDVVETVTPSSQAVSQAPQAAQSSQAQTQAQPISSTATSTTQPSAQSFTPTSGITASTQSTPIRTSNQLAYVGSQRMSDDGESGLYADGNIRSGFAKLNPEQISVGGLTALGSIVLGAAMLALSRIQSHQSILGLLTGSH